MTNNSPTTTAQTPARNRLLEAPAVRPFTPREREAPLTHVVNFYFAGSLHIQSFCAPMGLTAFKAGITGCADPQARVRDLRRQNFAGILLDPDDPLDKGILLPQSHEWFLVPVQQGDLKGMPVPENIAFINGHLALTIPAHVTMTDVDRAVHGALKQRSLRSFLAQPDNQARMTKLGYKPKAWFHTRYDLMTETDRISAVQELYILKPRIDLPDVVLLLAALMAQLSQL